jgi:hypothetical protein
MVIVFDSGFYIFCPTNPQNPFVIDMDAMVMPQVIIDTAIALIWAFHMNLLNFFGKLPILSGSAAQFAGAPLVVSGTSHTEQLADHLNGITRL